MSRQSRSPEKNKKIILAVLLLVMAVVAVYQLFLSEPAPRKRPQPANAPDATATNSQTPGSAPQRQPPPSPTRQSQDLYLQQLLADTSPLNLAGLTRQVGSSQVGNRGNIFAFYVPPPEPPPPPPPPPPIDLQFIQPQTAVAGTPRQFTLTVTGKDFPADANVIIDGRVRETKRVNATTLSTEIVAADYASPRNMNVEVKSQGDPGNFWSKGIPFIVQPAPEPPFKYIGRIGDQAILEMSGTKEIARLKVGDTAQGIWRIDAISDAAIDLTHTQYEIKKRVQMQDKGR